MKKILSVLLAAMAAGCANAQQNPHKGFILTCNNDTVYGTIDYRSGTKNAQKCIFRAEGSNEYKEYSPGEIKGYRFLNDGVFYVTRTFPVDGTDKTFFAEFMVQGGLSLYRHKEDDRDYYYFEDENGKVAVLKDTNTSFDTGRQEMENKRDNYQDVSQMLGKSPEAVNRLWKSGASPKKLTELTRRYNNEFCTSHGDCILFEYSPEDAKSAQIKFRVEAGVKIGETTATNKTEEYSDRKFDAVIPQVGLGMDILFPRFNRNTSLQALLKLGYLSVSDDYEQTSVYNRDYKVKALDIELQIGAAYSFIPAKRFSPLIRGGFTISNLAGLDTENMNNYKISGMSSSSIDVGLYAGIGGEMTVGGHKVSLTANYVNNTCLADPSGLKRYFVSVAAGFRF